MADAKTISAYASIPLLATVLVMAGLSFVPEPSHYCDSISKKAYCFGLSSGIGTRCYQDPDKKTYKNCGEGWKVMPEIAVAVEASKLCEPVVIAYTDTDKYFCEGIGKEKKCIKTDDILSELG